MTDLRKKSQTDWDDRVRLHYRFWMGEEDASDEEMWAGGKRDLAIMLEDLDESKFSSWKVIEYGSGVGRLLAPATKIFSKVSGVDISPVATEKAKELLGDIENLELHVTSGDSLEQFKEGIFDLCFSFACLNHVPLELLPNILFEIQRVVKQDGFIVLQLYIGPNHEAISEDTMLIRGYPETRLIEAFNKMGLELINQRALILPYDTIDHDRGLNPFIFTLKKTRQINLSKNEIKELINPIGEKDPDPSWPGSNFDYRLAATLLKRQTERGEIEEAIKTIEYAISKYKNLDPGVPELLENLKELSKLKAE